MDAIEHAAYASVGRACGFAALAVGIIFISLSFDPALAARVAGEAAFFIAGILGAYGWRAPKRPYQRTEAWLILADNHKPPRAIAQRLVGNAIKEAAYGFARKSVACSVFLLTASLVFQFAYAHG